MYIIVGCGGISTCYLAIVASFPNPNDKIRSLTLKVQGGGNVGNAHPRLGLAPRVISKVRPFSFSLALPSPVFLYQDWLLLLLMTNQVNSNPIWIRYPRFYGKNHFPGAAV
jgi:hypothetical protein